MCAELHNAQHHGNDLSSVVSAPARIVMYLTALCLAGVYVNFAMLGGSLTDASVSNTDMVSSLVLVRTHKTRNSNKINTVLAT